MKERTRVILAQRRGRGITAQARTAQGGVVSVDIALAPGESVDAFRARAAQALREAVVEAEGTSRRAAKCAAALAGLEIELERPHLADVAVNGDKLEGSVGAATARLLVVLAEVDGDREVVVTPNKHGRISVGLGGGRVVSVTSVSPDGLLGDDQAVS